ncbi:pyrin [Hippopotamus amphibius kiboko]|uniref:pyrin n=1 Tax=Hippopotamus amphibius kiboko TaxID=575201 RepID=UPI0025978689|nr:pyrin [Hippopotamus amphibius kiboko]
MDKTHSDHLLYSLEELVPYDFEKFKFKLQNTSLEKEHSRIPRGQLQTAQPVKLADLLVTHYGEEDAVRLTLQVLRAINQYLLAEELHRAIGPEFQVQESDTDSSAMSGSSGEIKPKSLKIPDGLEGDKQRQSGDGAGCPPCIQPEAGRGPQKKPLTKRRDQKGSEGLDVQGKPGARNTTLFSKRSSFPGKPQGEKGSDPRVGLRRNASSAGRLQGLSSGSYAGSPGRRGFKTSEACLPSRKKRPKSLEFTISPGETEPLNPEILLLQEKMRTENQGSAAALNTGATVAPEKGSRNPEHAVTLEGGALKNTISNVSLAGKKKIWEHLESTVPAEKSGIEAPKTSETLEEAVDGVLHEPSNPEGPPFSGRLKDKAVCPLYRAQEGDPVGGSCVHVSCSCSVASRDPEASCSRSSSCPRCQDLLLGKNHGSCEWQEGLQMASLSPNSLPQCERHMKQVQLLFCEDHGEPICLICRLSQEHRGHRVRPIEEAALEYKEQIQKQLEDLKELRKSREEQRSQGDKKTLNSLKQAETQKQRIQNQLEQLCQFLEQQEQLFAACLEGLGQTIGQVRETYGTQMTKDIALLDKLIGELEAKQCQPEWELMKDIGVTLHRAKMVTVSELWATPPEVKEKIHLLYQKSEFVEKRMKLFLETLRSEMETFNVNEILEAETAHPNLIFHLL